LFERPKIIEKEAGFGPFKKRHCEKRVIETMPIFAAKK